MEVECTLCHRIKHMRADDLYHSRTNSCVCQNIKHGLYKSRLYRIYANMKYRCYNSNCDAYVNYGEKGICLCEDWLGDNGFMNFYNWSMNNGYADNLTIDRIDENGNYCPENCRWITLSENVAYANHCHNRRHAKGGTYYGISPDGEYFEFDNANEFARNHTELNANNIRDVANKRKKSHKGWKFGFKDELITKPQSTTENIV